MQIVRRSAFKPSPWKNGGGVTHEAIREPAEGGHFRWRVSVADVSTSGPFSEFSGYDRTMVLLQGAGVRLSFAGGREVSLDKPGDLVEFDGGVPTECELIDGSCVDLNLMVAHPAGPAQVWVESVANPVTLTPGEGIAQVVFPIGGALNVYPAGAPSFELGTWDLLVLEGGEAADIGPVVPAPTPAPVVFLAMLRRG